MTAPKQTREAHRKGAPAVRAVARSVPFETSYRRQPFAALTTALLYDCRALHERQSAPDGSSQARASNLVARFRQLVAHCFQDHCSVESYASHLHVSADHLGAVLRKHTGRTARDFIDERVVLEAMRLGYAAVSSIGVALSIERLLDFSGTAPVTPGLYFPHVLLDPATAVTRFEELGLHVRRA
jgi:hypothetical protein